MCYSKGCRSPKRRFTHVPVLLAHIIAVFLKKTTKTFRQTVAAARCAERYRIIRHGHYWRNDFDSTQGRLAVQRYCCHNPNCPRKTFSVLPPALLPYYRIPLSILLQIYTRHHAQGLSVSQCARRLNTGWNTAKRGLGLMRRILNMINGELTAGALPPTPSEPGGVASVYSGFFLRFFPRLIFSQGRPHKTIISK